MREEILKYILTLSLYDKQLAVDAIWEKIANENREKNSGNENSDKVEEPREHYSEKGNSLESWEEFMDMMISVNKNMYTEVLKMSVDEKISLVQDIWDGISDEVQENESDEEVLKVVTGRYEEYKKNPGSARNWEDVKRDFLNRK